MLTVYDKLLDLVFPPRCSGCRGYGVNLCPGCIERCRRLRNPSPDQHRRLSGVALLRSSVALYQYDAPLREAIHTFKYRRRRALVSPLAALFIEALPPDQPDCEVVIPVPLHASRLRERGFNQSALLADAVAQALSKRVSLDLRRTRQTERQVGMDRHARESNVRDAFGWAGANAPRSALLIDDVLTTGATLRECARALRAAGTHEVHALALAGDWL